MSAESVCRSCGAPIWWLFHERTQKRAPIESTASPIGNVVVDLTAQTWRLRDPVKDVDQPRHRNHFAACPQSRDWRRAG